MDGTGFLLSGVQSSVQQWVLKWTYEFGVTLGSLYIDTQGYVPVLLENLCGMSCSGTYWLLGGWFQRRYGCFSDDLLLINVLCSQEFSGVLRFWGLSLLPLDFSLILPIASRLLHPYNTDNKTSRLMVKRFSNMSLFNESLCHLWLKILQEFLLYFVWNPNFPCGPQGYIWPGPSHHVQLYWMSLSLYNLKGIRHFF